MSAMLYVGNRNASAQELSTSANFQSVATREVALMSQDAAAAPVISGDSARTSAQANRFASAFLLPRSTFASECRLAIRGTRLNWPGLSELKLRWGVSKAAIIFRGRQLGVFSDDQARAGYVKLNRHGEAVQESEDHLIANEEPEVISESLKVMKEHFGVPQSAVAREMRVQPSLLQALLMSSNPEDAGNVVSFLSAGRSARASREGTA
jgi:Zn-dependent peptidase ImmA (M78 family)